MEPAPKVLIFLFLFPVNGIGHFVCCGCKEYGADFFDRRGRDIPSEAAIILLSISDIAILHTFTDKLFLFYMKIELLAPAGNLEKLKIAILYGADAVYIAGQEFGLRSAAGNFSDYEIEEAIRFVHQKQRKIYITLNAFLHDREIRKLPLFLDTLNSLGPDGVICSDLGVVEIVKRHSNIPIHISTQASVLNSPNARIWQKEGVKRIVAGRELSLQEAADLKRRTGMEMELFIHGAMCMSYSGYCSISGYMAERDSNRGGCIQSCRFKYHLRSANGASQNAYFLNSRDLCGIALLDRFLKYGIDSMKIEGRMKSGLYIASVVRAYYQALNDIERGKQPNYPYYIEELKKVPYRDYTDGSLESPAGIDSVYNEQDRILCRYEMAGMVLETDLKRGRFAFQAKSRLKIGDLLEILPARGEPITVEITQMTDMSESAMEIIQPNSITWLDWQNGIEAHHIARIARY